MSSFQAGRRVGILLLLANLFLGVLVANAAQINEVRHEDLTVDANQAEGVLNVPSLFDLQKTFFLLNYEVSELHKPSIKDGKKISGGEGAGRFGLYWSDVQTVKLFRERSDDLAGTKANASVQMVSFKDGLKVQSGVSIFDPNTIEKSISIEPIQLNKAFPLIQVVSEDWFTNQSESFTFIASFENDSTLKLSRNNVPEGDREANAATTKVVWQVVEFLNGATVRSGEANILYYSASTDVNLSEQPIADLSKAFLVFNYAGGTGASGCEGLIHTRGTIANQKLIQFNRARKGKKSKEGLDIRWYLVELNDQASLVQKGSEHFGASDFFKQVTFDKIDPERSMVLISSSGGIGRQEGDKASELMHNTQFKAKISGSTTLDLSRSNDPNSEEVDADVDWFVIEFAPLTMGTPKGGEVFRVGNKSEITWQHASSLEHSGKLADGSHQVSLYLSFDEGNDLFPERIASKIPARNDSYFWTVPERIEKKNLIGSRLRMKIVDADLPNRNSDVSQRNFAIKGNLKLVAPRAGDIWRVGGQDQEIVWNYQGALGSVSIYYDLQSGLHFDSFPAEQMFARRIAPGTNGVGSFSLPNVPDLTCKTLRIKVVQDSDPTVYDISRNDFAILPAISIVSPGIERDQWTAQTEQLIKWKTRGSVPSFDLFYSVDRGKRWNLIAANQSKGFDAEFSYLWQVPIEAIEKVVLIKVEMTGMKEVAGISSNIEEEALQVLPWIEIVKPKPDTILPAGAQTSVVWRTHGEVRFLQVDSSIDAGKTWAKEGVVIADADDFKWTVPNRVSGQLMIRLTDTDNIQHRTLSAMLRTKGTIEVLFPNGGEVLKTNEAPVIRWKKSDGIAGVDIRYSTDGGLNYPDSNVLATNISGESWSWSELPYYFKDNVKVRVTSRDDSSIFDESDKTFSIQAT